MTFAKIILIAVASVAAVTPAEAQANFVAKKELLEASTTKYESL